MATIGDSAATLLDFARREDPDGKIATIIELLTERNDILMDMRFIEGNLPTGHRTTVRTGLPTSTWRQLNYGVQPSKSTTKQVDDTAGMLEAYAEVDKALADLSNNAAAFRLSEDMAFLESMNQTMADTLFYGNTDVNPERFMGLAPRYNSISTDRTKIGYNVIDAGGTGADNTSIWLIAWDPNTIHGFFPRGSKAGFMMEDLGQETLTDAAGGRYEGYRTHYKWDIGLSVRDWRFGVRIANIDVSDLVAGSGANVINEMIRAMGRIESLSVGTPMFYMNRSTHTELDLQTTNKSNAGLDYVDLHGRRVPTFRGVPIRIVDAILDTEDQVV